VRVTLARWLPALAACVLSASWALGAVSDSQPVLTQDEILGTWSNHNGSTITFTSYTNFTAVAIDLTAGNPAGPQDCDSVTGSGIWEFLSPEGDSAGGGYPQGNQIWLQFRQSPECDAQLDTWEINPPVGLCLSFDPDTPCSSASPWTKES